MKKNELTEKMIPVKRQTWKVQNRRQQMVLSMTLSLLFLAAICVGGMLSTEAAGVTDFSRKNLPPGVTWLFGTDWLGRDMFARTLKGMSVSMLIGIFAAVISAGVALFAGTAAAVFGKKVDGIVTFLIDLIMGIPHILLMILICVAAGRGLRGVTIAVALTHWPSLARLIRAEVLQLKDQPYILIAEKLGKSKWEIAKNHILPHLLPQFAVGLVLLFPHAILHEASMTFLGFGLSSEQPAIGNILSESAKYLMTGQWWLALFPGIVLVMAAALFYTAGENLRRLTDPGSVHE